MSQFMPSSKSIIREPAILSFILILSLFFGLFIIYPLIKVLHISVFQNGNFSLQTYKEILSHRYNIIPLFNSITLGLSTAFLGTIIGYVMAYCVSMVNVPFRRFFYAVSTFPIVSPPFVIALAAIMLFGNNGIITTIFFQPIFGNTFDIYGFNGLLLVETLSYFPTAFLIMIGVFSSFDPVLEEAAKNQGANGFSLFKDIIFPLSLPGIYSSFLLIFIESLADFGNPLILAGDFKVLSVESYLKITGEFNLDEGSALSMMLLLPSLIAFFCQKYFLERKTIITTTGKPSSAKRPSASTIITVASLTACLAVTAFVSLFYLTVLYGSFVTTWGADNTITIKHYIEAVKQSWSYIKDSLILSAIATPITGILGMLIAYILVRKQFIGKSLFDITSMLTFAVPGTVVGIGYILAFNEPPLLLTGTASIIILLLIFRNAPVGIRAGVTALQQIDPAIEEASANLGASSFRTFFQVVLPLISPAFFSGLTYSFVRSMTAISAVIFVVSGKWNLVTIAILGFVENSYLSRASAMCMLLVVFIMIVLGLMQLSIHKMGYSR